MNKLTINDKTSVSSVQNFLVDKQGKLLATKNSEGHVELYLSPQSPSVWSRITGTRARQKALARRAIDNVFYVEGKAWSEQLSKGPDQKSFRTSFSMMLDPILKYRSGHALSAKQVLLLSKAAHGLEKAYPTKQQPAQTSATPSSEDAAIPNTKTSITTVWGQTRDMPNISVAGKEYAPTKYLGEGGFADVFEYTLQEGGKKPEGVKKIAIKVAKKKDDAETQKMFAAEARLHAKAAEGGHANVLGFKGVIESPEFGIAIAMESAPHGDVYALAQKIADCLKDQAISVQEATILRLTLFKDLAEGLQEVGKTMLHGDFKPPNCFLGADGRAKIADFGAARDGNSVKYEETEKVDNPRWKSPEQIYAKAESAKLHKFEHADLEHSAAQYRKAFLEAFPDLKNATLHIRNILLPDIKKIEGAAMADTKIDAWALGVSGINIFTGRDLMPDERFNNAVEEKILAVRAQGDGQVLANRSANGSLPDTALAESTGLAGADRIITGLLHPDPNKRWSPADALKDPVFGSNGVGAPESRELLIAIQSGDSKRIADARKALAPIAALPPKYAPPPPPVPSRDSRPPLSASAPPTAPDRSRPPDSVPPPAPLTI